MDIEHLKRMLVNANISFQEYLSDFEEDGTKPKRQEVSWWADDEREVIFTFDAEGKLMATNVEDAIEDE